MPVTSRPQLFGYTDKPQASTVVFFADLLALAARVPSALWDLFRSKFAATPS